MRLNGQHLRDARDRKGLSIVDLSEALNMSNSTISAAENGEEVRPSTGRRLCDFLQLDLAVVVVPRVPDHPEPVDA